MKEKPNGYVFHSKEEFLEFLYRVCSKEERKELKRRIGKLVLEGE